MTLQVWWPLDPLSHKCCFVFISVTNHTGSSSPPKKITFTQPTCLQSAYLLQNLLTTDVSVLYLAPRGTRTFKTSYSCHGKPNFQGEESENETVT